MVAFLRSVESLLIPQAILDSQFSILNCPGLSPALEIPEENVRDGIVPSLELRIDDDDFKANRFIKRLARAKKEGLFLR